MRLKRIAHYDVTALIGEGGMGQVASSGIGPFEIRSARVGPSTNSADGAAGGHAVDFSPDGEWLLFSSAHLYLGETALLKKVPISGGPAVTICGFPNRGATIGPIRSPPGSARAGWHGATSGTR